MTTLEDMLLGARSFNQSLNDWDKVTTMEFMFEDAWNPADQPIGAWDTSMRHYTAAWSSCGVGCQRRRHYASSFNGDIGAWDVSRRHASRRWMKYIGKWRVESVTDMRYMFEDAFAFNRPIGNWDVSNVEDMYGMFEDAFAFNQAIGGWISPA